MLRHTLESLLHILYPRLCIHCREPASALLCDTCSRLMMLLDSDSRCPTCFEEQSGLCERCHKSPSPFDRVGAALPYRGACASLVQAFKYGSGTYLAKGLAGFLVAQFVTLEWPMPNVIVPAPQSWLRRLVRGFNQAEVLAAEVGRLLDVPLLRALGRRAGDVAQAHLPHKERQALSADSFYLRRTRPLHDQTILLIDDVMTTGTTLQRCGERLREAFPGKIYALTLCKAGEG